MSKHNKTIKFFISSTFKDFEQERDILHKFVFPKLKDICHKAKFGFQPIDLRWGVMDEAGYDQQTMNICLNEIKRSSHEPKPNLLLLVGQRYGWVPLPYGIEAKEFEEILKKVSSDVQKGFKKSDKDVIEEWYILDKNAIPHTYYLKDKHKYKDDRDGWSKIENQIKAAFQKASSDPKYHTSATEQEMDEGLNAINNEHTFAYFRTITDYEKVDEKIREDFIDLDLEKLGTLSEKLKKYSNIPKENQIIFNDVKWKDIKKARKTKYEALSLKEAPKYLQEFHDEILKIFTEAIEKEIVAFTEKESSELAIELEEQERFKTDRAKIVIGRDADVKKINDFITDTKNEKEQFYLLYGKSGSGKSSVMAKAVSEIEDKEYKVLYRFIGTSALSTYSRVLFESLYWEIEQLLTGEEIVKKESLNLEYEEHKFKKQFLEQLKKLSAKGENVVIFLDALDQFEDYNDLSIIVDNLPEKIKVVFSTLYDEKKADKEDYSKYYNRLEYLAEGKDSLKAVDSNASLRIIYTWIREKNRTLRLSQYRDIIKLIKENDFIPLHLKLIFEMLKHFKVDDKIDTLKETEEDLIIQFFEFIQKKYHHDKLLMKRIFGFISASKDGLSEEEIIDLVSRDRYLLNKFQNDRYQKLPKLPSAIWSRFYYYIEDVFTEKLIDGEMLITPFHRVIAETIKKHYYDKDAKSLHKKLANYFLTLQDKKEVWDKRYNNLHMLSETPYQLFKSKNIKRLKKILFDLEFAGSVYDNHKQESFREIMEKASELKGISDDEMYVWESFYREKEHLILKVDEEMWRPHQSLFQLAYEDGEDSDLSVKSKRLLNINKIAFSWLKRKNTLKNFKRSGLLKFMIHDKTTLDNLEILDNGNILSISENFTFHLWNNKGDFLASLDTTNYIVANSKMLKYKRIFSINIDNNTIEILKINEKNLKILRTYKYLDNNNNFLYAIYNIKFLNNKKFISCTWGILHLWNNDKKVLSGLKGHTRGVIDFKILKNGNILSYSDDNTFRLWDCNGNFLKFLDGHKEIINNVKVFHKGRFISYDEDNFIILWSEEGTLLKVSNINQHSIIGIEVLEDERFISYGDDNIIRLWSKEGKILKTFKGHNALINGIVLVSNEQFFSYSDDCSIILWATDGKLLRSFKGHNDSVNGIVLLDNKKFFSYSDDYSIRLWEKNGNLISIYEGHFGAVKAMKILSNERFISYANDNTLRIWDTSKHYLKNENTHKSLIINIEKLKDDRIISYAKDNNLILWSDKGKKLTILEGHTETVTGVKLLYNGNIVSCSNDTKLRLWDNNGKYLKTLNVHTSFVRRINILKDGTFISSSADKTLILWSKTAEFIRIINYDFKKDFAESNGIVILKDDVIASYSFGIIKIWNINGTLLSESKEHNGWIKGINVLNNGGFISYGEDHNLILWDNNYKIVKILKGHTKHVNGVKSLNDGTFISYSNDKSIRLWDNSGHLLNVLKGHMQSINGLEILNDKKFISFSLDMTLRLWNSDGKLLQVMKGHKDRIMGVQILANGKILSYSHDGSMRLWTNNGELISIHIILTEFPIYHYIKDNYIIANTNNNLLIYNHL